MSRQEQKLFFAKAVAGYIRELEQDSVVSTSHKTLRTLYELYGEHNVQNALDRHWARSRFSFRDGELRQPPTFFCQDWDSDARLDPYPIVEIATGKVWGQLQSTDWEAVEHAPGIQHWSKPL